MVCQILDVLYIHPLPYLSDPTDPMTCLRPDLLITPTPFGVATPGLGTPDLLSFETSCKRKTCKRLTFQRFSYL